MKYQSMGGLRVKNGRLENDRPDGVTGIQEMANNRKSAKRSRKTSMISEGILKAEMMKTVMGKVKK